MLRRSAGINAREEYRPVIWHGLATALIGLLLLEV
jgi:hypothetical protein